MSLGADAKSVSRSEGGQDSGREQIFLSLTHPVSPGVSPAAAAKAAKYGELLPCPPPKSAGCLDPPTPWPRPASGLSPAHDPPKGRARMP